MIYLLSNGKQQIIAYGNPNLREYSILARSVERLDMQSLSDPFEETFHFLALQESFGESRVQKPVSAPPRTRSVRSVCVKRYSMIRVQKLFV